MKRSRQRGATNDLFDPTFLARSLAVAFEDGHVLPWHDHPWPQLVYADQGVMQVSTRTMTWLVPPTRAIWMPAGEAHSIRMRGPVHMRTLYLAPESAPWPPACQAIEVPALLREVILHLVAVAYLDPGQPAHARLVAVLADLIERSETLPLTLPLPTDPRALKVARRIVDDPASPATLTELAADCGASTRTLQRLFRAETGLGLEAWRLRARMQQAVVSLSEGVAVTEAAFATGYGSASAFIAAFKRCFGVTPTRYRRPQAQQADGAREDAAPRPTRA